MLNTQNVKTYHEQHIDKFKASIIYFNLSKTISPIIDYFRSIHLKCSVLIVQFL